MPELLIYGAWKLIEQNLKNKTGKIKIAAVGDIMLGDNPLCLGFGIKSKAALFCLEKFYRYRIMNLLRLFKWVQVRARYIKCIKDCDSNDLILYTASPRKVKLKWVN